LAEDGMEKHQHFRDSLERMTLNFVLTDRAQKNSKTEQVDFYAVKVKLDKARLWTNRKWHRQNSRSRVDKIASNQNHQESGRHELLGLQMSFAPRNLVYEKSTAHGRTLETLFEHMQMPKAYVCDFHSARRLFGRVQGQTSVLKACVLTSILSSIAPAIHAHGAATGWAIVLR
jgi:hypothetical protein